MYDTGTERDAESLGVISGRAEVCSNARCCADRDRASARRSRVSKRGFCLSPRSRSLIPRVESPARAARASCERLASRRYFLSSTPKLFCSCIGFTCLLDPFRFIKRAFPSTQTTLSHAEKSVGNVWLLFMVEPGCISYTLLRKRHLTRHRK